MPDTIQMWTGSGKMFYRRFIMVVCHKSAVDLLSNDRVE